MESGDSGGNVVDEAGYCGSYGEVGAASDRFDVRLERGDLIADEMEFDILWVGTGGIKHFCSQTRQIDLGRSAIVVMHDGNAVNFKLVD